jgi:hypothetical protein
MFAGLLQVTVGRPRAIVNVTDTGVAAMYRPLPFWYARTVQLPALVNVILLPFVPVAVQLPDVWNVTGLPDAPPLALAVNGASPK